MLRNRKGALGHENTMAIEKERLAMVYACEKFHYYIYKKIADWLCFWLCFLTDFGVQREVVVDNYISI